MSSKENGSFSLGVKSLQLLAQSLFEDCGGDRAIALLDALSDLNGGEQQRVIPLFISVIERLRSSEGRLASRDDVFLKDFEEALYKDLLSSMREAAQTDASHCDQVSEESGIQGKKRRLKVLDGGKGAASLPPSEPPLDLVEARRKRMSRASRVN